MKHDLELLTKRKISISLNDKHKSYRNSIVILDRIASTNTYLAQQIKSGNRINTICFAESQKAGKGRLGRKWLSPYARNIYLSLAWSFVKDPHELSGLSLATAVGVADALKNYGITQGVNLKWPNDVLWQKRKLAGVLIEVFAKTHKVYNAIIGVGLNVNMPKKIGQKIDQPWCDIAKIIKDIPSRNKLAGLLLDQLLTTMDLYQSKGLAPFIDRWRSLDIVLGKAVCIKSGRRKIYGIGRGIDTKGNFLLEKSDGQMQSFIAGEVSLRF